MKKLILLAAAVALTGAASAQSFTPSHPLSHIHPVDVDLNMSNQEIYNVSEFSIRDGLTFNGRTIYEPDADGAAPILEWEEANESLEVYSDIDLNNNNIQKYFQDDTCQQGYLVDGINPNGTYECTSINQTASEIFVEEAGDTMSGDLNMSQNDINNVSDITNFYEDNCGTGQVVERVYENGSYQCANVTDSDEFGQNLSEVLDIGNKAQDTNINMSQELITDIGVGRSNFTTDGGLSLEGDLDMNLNDVENVENLYRDDSQTSFFESACGEFRAVKGIYPNGTYKCTEEILEEKTEYLNETLAAGNTAERSINMTGDNVDNIGDLNSNGSSLNIGGDVDFEENNIENIRAIQDGGEVDSLILDEENNILVPNGNIDLEGNDVNDTRSLSNNGPLTLESDTQDSNTGDLRLQTGGSDRIVALNDGQVRIPNSNLNISENQLDDVSRIDFRTGSSTSFIEEYSGDQLAINSQGDILRLQDSSSTEISAESNVRLNENDLEQVGELVINDNDSSGTDYRVREDTNGDFVVEQGSTDRIRIDEDVSIPNDNLDLDSNNITDISNLYEDDSQTNFFDAACGEFRALKGINPNGTFICTEEILEEKTEGLNETLDAGNFAGPRDIYMNGSQILEVGTGRTNFTDSGGLEIAGDTSLNDNVLDETAEINSQGTNLDVNAAQTDFKDNEINNASKVGIKTDNPDENLDVEGSANISSSGTSMNVKDNGNVVVTLG